MPKAPVSVLVPFHREKLAQNAGNSEIVRQVHVVFVCLVSNGTFMWK